MSDEHKCPNCGAFPVERPGPLERNLTAAKDNLRTAKLCSLCRGRTDVEQHPALFCDLHYREVLRANEQAEHDLTAAQERIAVFWRAANVYPEAPEDAGDHLVHGAITEGVSLRARDKAAVEMAKYLNTIGLVNPYVAKLARHFEEAMSVREVEEGPAKAATVIASLRAEVERLQPLVVPRPPGDSLRHCKTHRTIVLPFDGENPCCLRAQLASEAAKLAQAQGALEAIQFACHRDHPEVGSHHVWCEVATKALTPKEVANG